MKKFILFCWSTYYPKGGLNDLVGSFDTTEEAEVFAKQNKRDEWQLVDRDSWKIIWTKSI